MIIDDELYIKIHKAEKDLAKLEKELGPDHLQVAEAMEHCAWLMKRAGTRLPEAADLQARAQIIRNKSLDQGAVFDASVPPLNADYNEELQREKIPTSSDQAETTPIDETFWDKTISVEFKDTMYLPNHYNPDSDLHELEVLAFAYENNDKYACASMSNEDAIRVWGWIVKQRTGRYPKTSELVDQKAKRLRRWDLDAEANTLDFRVTPRRSLNSTDSSNRKRSGSRSGKTKKKREPEANSTEPNFEEAVQHLQSAAQIIGGVATEGMKEVAQQMQEATKDLGKNVQIITGILDHDLRKWLKKNKKRR